MNSRTADAAMTGLAIVVWLALATAFVVGAWPDIVGLRLPDPDDALRLAQVRDWLDGAGWYDTVQLRINPPDGVHMHWSRLVDAPLAAGIIALDPLVGRAWAERLTATFIPVLTFGLIAFGAARATSRLVAAVWAPVAVVYVGLSSLIFVQTMPLRIDHHGWQLLAAVAAFVALLEEDRPVLSGAVAGGMCALWTHISLEGLPMTVAMGALLGVRWILDPRDARRLAAFMLALTLASLAARLAAVPPAGMTSLTCDQVSGPHLGALLTACAALLALMPAAQRFGRTRLVRLACTAAAGAGGAGVFVLAAGPCLAMPFGAFAGLDPLVRALWLDRVGESRPLIAAAPLQILADTGMSAMGLIGACLALRRCARSASGDPGSAGARSDGGGSLDPQRRQRQWASAAVLGAVSLLLSLIVMERMGAVAQAFAVPGAIHLLRALLLWARKREAALLRIPATVAAAIATGPLLGLPHALLPGPSGLPAGPQRDCLSGPAWETLQAAPAARVLTPLDIGPQLITASGHSVLATAHHRNHVGMALALRAFTLPAGFAHDLMAARGYSYIAYCPSWPETRQLAHRGPDGLMSQLLAGRPPAWLTPVPGAAPTTDGLRVWRVAPAAAPGAASATLTPQ